MESNANGAADNAWGYPFGVDGLMNLKVAMNFLCVSDRQLDRLTDKGFIRKGKTPGKYRVFCRRSIVNYANSLEQ